MKKYALTGTGAAGLILALVLVIQRSADETVDRSKGERIVTPSASRGLEPAPVVAVADREENGRTPIAPAKVPSPVALPPEDPIRRLLQDVAAGRLVLDTNEEEFGTLDLSRSDVVPVIVRLWAQKHWAEAAQWAQALPESDVKSAALRQLAVLLTPFDPSAARQWIDTLKAGPSRDAAVESMSTQFASAYPEQALQLAEELPQGDIRDQTLTHILSQWGAQDPSVAVASARTIEDPALRSRALAAVATAWAASDPAGAGTFAVQEIDDEAAQTRAVVSIVQRWARKDPATAAAWVQQFEPGDLSNNTVEQLVAQWSLQDAEAPRRWLITLPDAATRDAGLASLARTLAQSQPAQAAQCAALIIDPSRRQACLAVLGNR
ncbi:hypothetical protein CfE428DRAFT_1650 [Chthoniobacter flavus Ellin428]|uniref:Uncharacterized protein n=1 Tax=Chthoniobacter flavus Ellin428 TaxID=497964 RepID=B4CYB2_9BACT|nr:hypothetical protein [Chthoniobacter flavus]EDY20453.1 hypothetical protein CfE428DRAFT_1650 [Chthoniobacter flavus Ellin428]TCO85603.1 hypothetical protein EV701_13161 [Chthoniobacter flavus]